MNIILGDSDTSILLTKYEVTIQVEPANRVAQEDENTVLSFNVNQITPDFRLVLHFNLALNKDLLFGVQKEDSERRLQGDRATENNQEMSYNLSEKDLSIEFKDYHMKWTLERAIPRLGSYTQDNVQDLVFKLEVGEDEAYGYNPFSEPVAVTIWNKQKFVSVGGTKLKQASVIFSMPGYTASLGSQTDSMTRLGLATGLLPFCVFFVQMLFKYKFGANLSHSYFGITFV